MLFMKSGPLTLCIIHSTFHTYQTEFFGWATNNSHEILQKWNLMSPAINKLDWFKWLLLLVTYKCYDI